MDDKIEGFKNLLFINNICLANLDDPYCEPTDFQESIIGYMGIKERNDVLQGPGCILIY